MELAGQPFDVAHGKGHRGYAMAALLVGMSVMAVLMSALLPVWTHLATREKEEELIFRGNQYSRAIGLFQRKFANTAPPSIDVLVEQRFLRKKYKDPITNDDFQPLYANQQALMPGAGGQVAQRPGQNANQSNPVQQAPTGSVGSGGITPQGGIIGVTSKSKEASIKQYNGRSRYNEWSFIYLQTAQRPGQPGMPQGIPGQGGPGQGGRGGRPGEQGQQGQQPFGVPNMPPGFGQPNRPPIGMPGQMPGQPFPNQQNPNTIIGPGGTTMTQMPQGPRRPGGQ
jgi:type II secretory pathway pseudopilin PulG